MENLITPLAVKEEKRVYGEADKAACKQLYFTLLGEKNIAKEVSKILNFPLKIVQEWEVVEKWKEEVKEVKKNQKKNIKDLNNEENIIRDNLLLRSIITKKLEEAATGTKITANEIKSLNEMLEKINNSILGDTKETPGHVVILMDKTTYEKAREKYGDKWDAGEAETIR